MATSRSLPCLVVLTALVAASCDRSPLEPDRTTAAPSEAVAAKPAAGDPLQPSRIDFEYDTGDGLIGYLTLEVDGTQFVYEGESVDAPAPRRVTFDGNGETLEFTEFRMGMSSGREGSSGEATARRLSCKLWALSAFAQGAFYPLEQAKVDDLVCKGTYQFYTPSRTGNEVFCVETWSIAFDNGRINQIALVADPMPAPFAAEHIELEIVADQWELAGARPGRDE